MPAGGVACVTLLEMIYEIGNPSHCGWRAVDLFGGRQSARTVHFLGAAGITLFILVHVVLVIVSGLWNNMRSMITGYYTINKEVSK